MENKKIRLGFSLYPEQESLEEIEEYLKKGKEAGFDKVFTSLFSVEGTKEELMNYFKGFTELAHKYGYEVDGDCNGAFFDTMEATPEDISAFKEMGIDTLRMDFPFADERDAILINTGAKNGLKIEFNSSMSDIVEGALKNGADVTNITTCHNFYPERYTCPKLESVKEMNNYWKEKNIPVTMFMSSQEKGTHGPWPVSDGLPTVEEHRRIPVSSQLKHMVAMQNVDEALFGNAYASDEELKDIKKTMDMIYAAPDEEDDFYKTIKAFMPASKGFRIPFRIHVDPSISEVEKKAVFEYPRHTDMGDCLNYMLRSRFTRMLYKNAEFTPRAYDKPFFHRGDIVVVNDNCKHYAGEVQIVLKDMENDGQRNYIGTIVPEEILILDEMGAGDMFTFVPENESL